MKVTVEITRRLDCYEPTTEQAEGHITATAAGSKLHYYKRNGDFLNGECYFHYPLVIDPDGSLWNEANRYLLQRLNGVVPAKHRTLELLAYDLAYFRQWMLDEDIDYLDIPSRPHLRPTYRYCAFLHDEISFGHIKPGTAKRRMSTIQNFYRWLEHDEKRFNYPLWIEDDASLMFKDTRGFMRKKSFISTDLTKSFRAVRGCDEYSEYINDSGKLRPLPKDEQQALVESLKRVANTEMTLAFLFALTTGARLQQWRRWVARDGREIDQVQLVIDEIKNEPYGRRILWDGWNVGEIGEMALPPCHKHYQFFVKPKEGKLCGALIQRSADSFLGLGWNIANLALVTTLLAEQTNLQPGEIIWYGLDVHLYLNHISQAKEQVLRVPRPFPTLNITRRATTLFDYRIEDFNLENYDPHPHISAPMAV